MSGRVLVTGLLGGIAMFVWLFVTNALLPLKSDMLHNVVENQREVHRTLKENITEPGTYSCPYIGPQEEDSFPDYRNQPVFSITYEGMTHGEGSPLSATPFVVVFLVPIIAAWMLSMTSERFRAQYLRRVLFVALIGVMIALFDDILQMSFGPQPKDYLVFLAINNLICWILAGLVIASRVKPRTV